MSTRKNLPHRKEAKRKSALERRSADVSKYAALGEEGKAKLEAAKADVAGLKAKLGIS